MAKTKIQISDHFDFKRIFRFTISPILMMIFVSLYGIVDGFFISNFGGPNGTAGLDEYAGVNVIMPIIMVIGGIGFMFGTGGSALVGKYLGEQNKEKANKTFTMIVAVTAVVGLFISAIGFFFIKPIAQALGSINGSATEKMVEYATTYGRILMCGQMFFMLQNVFQSFLVVDEKPKLGFAYTLAAGITNMVLDGLFIAVFHWGVVGAATATALGYVVGSILPIIHFLRHKDGNICFTYFKLDWKDLRQSCFNGCSEFVSNVSSSIVGIVFNIQLLRYYGQNGVAAYGTLMYVSFVFIATFVGYVIGMAPVVSYNYGAKNHKELTNIMKRSLVIISILAVLMLLAGEVVGPLFAKAYVGSDPELLELTTMAFHIFSLLFLFCGFSIFFSSFFTALNNGVISAIISFTRTLVMELVCVLLLPLFMGKVGIWWSIVIAEFVSFLLSWVFIFAKSKKYGYFETSKKAETAQKEE